jgi:hypothetical protein
MQSNEQHIPDQTRSLNTMVHQQIGLDSSSIYFYLFFKFKL